MSRQWGEALRYFKKHSYRGNPSYNATMWHVKPFYQILTKNLRYDHVILSNQPKFLDLLYFELVILLSKKVYGLTLPPKFPYNHILG